MDGKPKHFCPSISPKRLKALVVGEAPSREDVEKQEPFSDRAGEELREMLEKVGAERQYTAFIHAVACMRKQPEKDPEMRKAIACCAPLFHLQMKVLQPLVNGTLAVGKWAAVALTGKEKAIGAVRGFYTP